MIDRLKVIMEQEGLNPSQLADRLHIQRSGLSHILSGRNNPSLDFVKKVLTEFPQYDMGWLIFGDTDVSSNVHMCNADVNSGVYKCEYAKELSLFDNSSNSGKTTIPNSEKQKIIYPSSFEKQTDNSRISVSQEKETSKQLVKVIMVYDNHTFEELKKSEY